VGFVQPIEHSFSIIRDPVDRFVSHFLWRVARFAEHDERKMKDLISKFKMFFDEFRECVAEHELFEDPHSGLCAVEGEKSYLHINDVFRHVIPQSCFLFIHGHLAVDEIFSINQMDLISEMLLRRAGIVQKIPRRMVGASSKALRSNVSETIERQLRSIYRFDLALLHGNQQMTRRLDV
jgi:hypothetical protein